MASKQRCCGFSKNTGKQCRLSAEFTTEENLHVCLYHQFITIEEITPFYEKQKQLLDNKQKVDVKKQVHEAKKQEQEEIEKYNEELLKEHPGEIPLRDMSGKIVNFALVDPEDYDEVMKYKWHQAKQHNGLIYARSNFNNTSILQHHFILGKPEDGNVIHHRDHNGLNNKRSNIVSTNIALNAQHKFKPDNCSSKYVGVTYVKKHKKHWQAQSSKVKLGNYAEEIEAAKAYDTYVYVKYGKEAHTNGLVNYDDIKHIDINTLIYKKQRELPNNIVQDSKNSYKVQIQYNKIVFKSWHPNIDAAKEKLEFFKNEIKQIKQREKAEHLKKPIVRNEKGQAILNIHNTNGNVVETVPVDDDRWHELTQYHWSRSLQYYQSVINGKSVLLHRYIMNAKDGEVVDHINDNGRTVNDHTSQNLRINTNSGNSHNRKKSENKFSQYIGVHKNKSRYNAKIIKDGVIYRLGAYGSEIEAAIAYNLKAKDLYKEFANQNTIPEELLQKYENEIIAKLQNMGKL